MFNLYKVNNFTLTVENCLFTGGESKYGIINAARAYSTTIAISNSMFTSSGYSAHGTSAVYVLNSDKAKPTKLTVKSTLFENLLGNPIYLDSTGATASISGCTFKNNVGEWSGAVYAYANAGASLSGNTFKNNKCTDMGTPRNCKANGVCKRVNGSSKCQ